MVGRVGIAAFSNCIELCTVVPAPVASLFMLSLEAVGGAAHSGKIDRG